MIGNNKVAGRRGGLRALGLPNMHQQQPLFLTQGEGEMAAVSASVSEASRKSVFHALRVSRTT